MDTNCHFKHLKGGGGKEKKCPTGYKCHGKVKQVNSSSNKYLYQDHEYDKKN